MYVVECQRLRDKYRFFFFLTKKINLRACGVLLYIFTAEPPFFIYMLFTCIKS